MSNPNHETFVNTSSVKMMLASRIMVASRSAEVLRERKVTTTQATIANAVAVAEDHAVMRELERIWEGLFEEFPDSLTVRQWAIRANQSSEV